MVSITEKIIRDHIVAGEYGDEIGLKIDCTLTQDAIGILAYLGFELLGLDRVKTEHSVSFVDHNTLQIDYKHADDQRYLQSVAARYGIYYSKPGNGICHQVYLERFAKPGKTLLGSDSHTPTAGAVGMLAFGSGALDVAFAMGGGAFYLRTPKIVGVKLMGKRPDYVCAKDVILELLRRITVRGGIGKAFEYFGPGIKDLTVPERATIANMGSETGATTSIFPSDEITRAYFKLQNREHEWIEIPEAKEKDFEEIIEIDLDSLEPLIAKPGSPDNVVPVSEVEGIKVDQVAIGSCTNSSLKDLMTVAALLDGHRVHPDTSLGISPGSRQVMKYLADSGELAKIISAGARIFENACGPCIGQGFMPPTGSVSLRTFNRNFKGRSGIFDANVYLCSPAVAVASAIYGKIVHPKVLGPPPKIELPERIELDDSMLIPPPKDGSKVKVIRGPHISQIPTIDPLPDHLTLNTVAKLGDNISTDDILPITRNSFSCRSDFSTLCQCTLSEIDTNFINRASKAKDRGGGIIIAGENFGQGASTEDAALAPLCLGVRVIIAKSFARAYRTNLINVGILPLRFLEDVDYQLTEVHDVISLEGIRKSIEKGVEEIHLINKTRGNMVIEVAHDFSEREKNIALAGGLLNYYKAKNKK